jgi:arylformamidase
VEIIDIHCDAARIIGPEDVADHSIEQDNELLLIRTGFELVRQEDKYWNDNPGQAPELADYLRSNFRKMRVIGFDI